MNPKSSVSLQFQRADARAEFERARKDLKGTLADGDFDAQAGALVEISTLLDTGVGRLKRDLVSTSLAWNEENQNLTLWIHQQHRAVLESGLRLVHSRNGDTRHAQLPRLVMLCMFHWAEAVKWGAARERDEYQALHGLYQLAAAGRFIDAPGTLMADGRGHSATVERLYLRALLLDRFASGSLTRQQVEIADAWLWHWQDTLQCERTFPGGACLRVDLDANAGLREGGRENEEPAIYVRLEPLEEKRREIVREMHRGRIIPPHGCTSEMRIEEHIAVLDYLQRAFRLAVGDTPQRAPREQQAGIRLEVWVGLSEILARGVGVGTETGRYRALQMNDPAIEEQSKRRYTEATRRYLWMSDSSATGFGFEALESDAVGIDVGDIIGWRKGLGSAIVLGHVVRRMPSCTSGQVFLGVRLLTENAVPLTLRQAVTFDAGMADGTYLFVPGEDDSGSRDSFVVSEKTFELQATYNAHIGAEGFALKFNRVRGRGRAWMLAGFEILPAKRDEVVVDALPDLKVPSFELELDPVDTTPPARIDEDSIALAWDKELSPRLLA
jgi:hypothetical protein